MTQWVPKAPGQTFFLFSPFADCLSHCLLTAWHLEVHFLHLRRATMLCSFWPASIVKSNSNSSFLMSACNVFSSMICPCVLLKHTSHTLTIVYLIFPPTISNCTHHRPILYCLFMTCVIFTTNQITIRYVDGWNFFFLLLTAYLSWYNTI